MSKEVDKKTCTDCESPYKLMYDLNQTSGYPKFCPFCGNEVYDESNEPEEAEED